MAINSSHGVLCSVDGEWISDEPNEVNCPLKGKILVLKNNEMLYTMDFNVGKKVMWSTDLDFVECGDNADRVIHVQRSGRDGKSDIVRILGEMEFEIIRTLIEDCRNVSELTLRLNTTMRDSFYGGIYSSLELSERLTLKAMQELIAPQLESMLSSNPLKDMLNGKDGFTSLTAGLSSPASIHAASNNYSHSSMTGTTPSHIENQNKKTFSFGDIGSPHRDKAGKTIGTELVDVTLSPSQIGLRINEMKSSLLRRNIRCLYCKIDEKSCSNGRTIEKHPWVEFDYQGRSLHLCSICLNNWKSHRNVAIEENRLMLIGERNEELCALCSDVAEELVMCGKCVRSYCNRCLADLLNAAELRKMEASNDWECMVCDTSLHPQTLKKIDGPKTANGKSKTQSKAKGSNSSKERAKKRQTNTISTSHVPPKAPIINNAPITNKGNVNGGDRKLPPVNTTKDEVYYFGQYMNFCHEKYPPRKFTLSGQQIGRVPPKSVSSYDLTSEDGKLLTVVLFASFHFTSCSIICIA
jgi:hypothetical protein